MIVRTYLAPPWRGFFLDQLTRGLAYARLRLIESGRKEFQGNQHRDER